MDINFNPQIRRVKSNNLINKANKLNFAKDKKVKNSADANFIKDKINLNTDNVGVLNKNDVKLPDIPKGEVPNNIEKNSVLESDGFIISGFSSISSVKDKKSVDNVLPYSDFSLVGPRRAIPDNIEQFYFFNSEGFL